jgi:3-oxoacyl-[acyl-carrier-protein] synthase-1
MVLAALAQIEQPIARALREYGADRVGRGDGHEHLRSGDAEDAIRHEVHSGGLAPRFDYAQLEFGGLASFAAEHSRRARSRPTRISTACSSGARALASARSLLALGVCDAVIAGAADTLCGLTANGFSRLSAVMRRASRTRAAAIAPGSRSARARPCSSSSRARAACSSSAWANPARRITCPRPIRRAPGAEAAMRGALADAGSPARRDRLSQPARHRHPLNDKMECLAVDRVFGRALPVSSTKPLVGHTLGAAGAIEAAFCWLVLDRIASGALSLPPHWWDGEADPELPRCASRARARPRSQVRRRA